MTSGHEKIDQVDSFTYLDSIISKEGGSSEGVKNRIAKAQGIFFHSWKKFGRTGRQVCELRLEYWTGTVMTEVKYDSEAWVHSEKPKKICYMFCREIAYGLLWVTWLTGRILQTVGCTKSVVRSWFLGL